MNTALSDLEVDYIDFDKPKKIQVPGHGDKWYEFGQLTHFLYKVKGTDRTIEIATTRLETMLGDVAVAVHPDDPRYKDLIGKELEHPIVKDRHMVVIADPILVDMNFGTGAVKVTPAHDPNDFICGERNNLPKINIFTEEGRINHNGGHYEGKLRFDVRVELEKELTELGLFVKKEPNQMRIGVCAKTGDIIEPLIKPQWYVNCKELAARSVDAVKKGELKLIPEFYKEEWFKWLDNIQDWCISRQLWWGHRIPAYLTKIEGVIDKPDTTNDHHWAVGGSEEEIYERLMKEHNVTKDKITLIQDEDVLDTWFSSGLFPFSTLGWPNESTEDYKAFFPGHILETGHDILFFWVARMVMMSLCLTDKLPFTEVYLHPLIKDKQGKKMSKSLGNVIDPLEVIDGCVLDTLLEKLRNSNLTPKEIEKGIKDKEKEFPDGIPPCGSDSLRFSLLIYMTQPRTINLDVKRIIGYRLFCSKIWNAVKLSLMYNPKDFVPGKSISDYKLSYADKWILNKLLKVIVSSNQNLANYQYGAFANNLYDFFQKDFCDGYLEASKVALQGADEDSKLAALNTIFLVLDNTLRLFHPMMPYITEELYQRLPHAPGTKADSIFESSYPQTIEDFKQDDESEANFESILKMVGDIRSMKDDIGLQKNLKPQVFIQLGNDASESFYTNNLKVIESLASTGEVTILSSSAAEPEGCIKKRIGTEWVFVRVVGIIDIKQEILRLKKLRAKHEKAIADIKKKLQGKAAEKMAEEAKIENQQKLEKNEHDIVAIDHSIEELQKLE